MALEDTTTSDNTLMDALWRETVSHEGHHFHRNNNANANNRNAIRQQLFGSGIHSLNASTSATSVEQELQLQDVDPLFQMQFHEPSSPFPERKRCIKDSSSNSLKELIRPHKAVYVAPLVHNSNTRNNDQLELPEAPRAAKKAKHNNAFVSLSSSSPFASLSAANSMTHRHRKNASTLSATATASTKGATAVSPPPAAEATASTASASLLHQSCHLFPQCLHVIESSLDMEPQAACQRAPRVRPGSNAWFVTGGAVAADNSKNDQPQKVPYSLPINILLHQGAPIEVIQLMATRAPKALIKKDGREDCSSLIIALRLHKKNPANKNASTSTTSAHSSTTKSIPEVLLTANPQAAQIFDRKRNFPLHVAAYVGANFNTISALYYAYPEALLEMNFHGETPLDIVVRNGSKFYSEETHSFLHDKTSHLKAARLRTKAQQH